MTPFIVALVGFLVLAGTLTWKDRQRVQPPAPVVPAEVDEAGTAVQEVFTACQNRRSTLLAITFPRPEKHPT